MRNSAIRAVAGLVLVSGWLALLFSGLAFGGAIHLLLAGGLGVFPWRSALKSRAAS
ncbi:MAG TPA: hypothetical protein VF173_24500 [Thermoanaerobaculia bacterium]|nr:hypothetical protein [Thermoanaerobaculia bacterium]